MPQYILCLVTIDNMDNAAKIANILVTEKLAACVNILPGVRSIYSWKGTLCDDSEHILLIKTWLQNYPALQDRVRTIHPYEVPEIIALPIEKGLPAYLSWIDDCLQ